MRGTDYLNFLKTFGFAQDFQDPDFEAILQRMLARVPNNIDKREGSVIYDALAPAAVELTNAYLERDGNRALSYASSSVGDWLDMRVAEHGVFRMEAIAAVRYGFFFADDGKTQYFDNVPIGTVYSVPNDALNYIVTERLALGSYALSCMETGDIGNSPANGTELLPVRYLPGLASVVLDEALTPGRDRESDDDLYQRFVWYITRPPFGGNRSGYEEYFRQIDGVGYVRLYRADPEKGHVTAFILGSDEEPPSAALVDEAQTLVDPIVNSGEGIGMAPMAHMVHVHGAQGQTIDIDSEIFLISGWTIGQVQEGIEKAVADYLHDLREHWADYVSLDSPLYKDCVVRIAQIDAAILEVAGVADVRNTKINGDDQNITLGREYVPTPGAVNLVRWQ